MAEDSSSKKFLDFKHTLKAGKDDLSLVQLGSQLRIEKSLWAQDSYNGKGKEVGGASVNMTEEGGKNKHHKQNKVVKRTTQMLVVWESGLRTNPKTKTYEPVEDGSVLDMGDDYFAPVHGKGSVALEFKVGGPSVSMTEEGGKNKHHKQNKVRLVTSKGIAEVVKRTTQMLVVWERGLRTNPKTKVDAIAWWIDSRAITYVCKDRCWFKTYEPVEDESVLYMGDDHFAPVHGKGSVALEFSFGKTITLFNVLYVPKLRNNLVSGPMLNKYGYKEVYESDKYILSKSCVFVRFGYYNNVRSHVLAIRMLLVRNEAAVVEMRYCAITSTYYRGAVGALLVYDKSRHETKPTYATYERSPQRKPRGNDPSALPKGQTINVGSKDDVFAMKKATCSSA
nr:zinc finger, CCHC-type [Tanacetum cinerariifolium]